MLVVSDGGRPRPLEGLSFHDAGALAAVGRADGANPCEATVEIG